MGGITVWGLLLFYLCIALVGGICATNIIRAINRLKEYVDAMRLALQRIEEEVREIRYDNLSFGNTKEPPEKEAPEPEFPPKEDSPGARCRIGGKPIQVHSNRPGGRGQCLWQ